MTNSIYPDRRELRERYNALLPSYIAALEKFQARLRAELCRADVHFTVKYRVKAFDSFYGKLLKRKRDEKKTGEAIPIHDILGTRVACPFLDDVERVEKQLREAFTIYEIERKGAERKFSEFGYSSTHLLIVIPPDIQWEFPDLDLQVAEVQVRTFLQDAWAEVEHELVYKNSNSITPMDEPLRRKLAALNANLSLSDDIFQEIRDYQRRLHCELNKRRHSFTVTLGEVKPGLTAAAPSRFMGSGGGGGVDSNGGGGDDHSENGNGSIINKSDNITNGNGNGNGINGMNGIFPDTPDITTSNRDQLLLYALNAHNEKNFPLAIKFYTKILGQEIPQNIRALVLIHRGKAYFSQSDYQEALVDFRLAAESEPHNSRAFYHLGIVNRVLGDNPAAMDALRSCVEINPFHVDALFALGGAHFDMQDYPGALEYCEKALLVEPDSTAAAEFRKLVISKLRL